MLIIEATVTKPCAKGTNLAEQASAGRKKVERSANEVYVETFAPVYVAGAPFTKAPPLTVIAPAPVQAGDLLLVEAEDYVVWKILRGDAVVYENQGLTARLDTGAADRAEKNERLAQTGKK